MNTDNKINFAFFGTPDVASKTLEILAQAGFMPSIIITSPDRPAGRGMHMAETPVSAWAQLHGIRCLKPEKISEEFIKELESLGIELSIVVAYGKILPQTLIDTPTLGTLNIHYSLLPKYRGASPVESALLNGDKVTGISIQQMVYKLDSGPILANRETSISLSETKEELRETLIKLGAETLVEILPKIVNKEIIPTEQDESEATHCTKIKKEDAEINVNGDGNVNYNKYRAYAGWPNTYFFVEKAGQKIRVKITKATYEDGSFMIEKVIPEGRKEVAYEDFLSSLK